MNELIKQEETSLSRMETGIAAAVSREQHEIQSAIAVAKRFPRNEAQASTAIVKACERPSMAEKALYSFPRKDKDGRNVAIEGLSVHLAREAARIWGNIWYGFRVVDWTTDDRVTLRGIAHDLEANAHSECEVTFRALVPRKNFQTKQVEWVRPSERDFRNLINQQGAIAERNAVLKLIPKHVKDDVEAMIRSTLEAAAAGDLKQNKEDAVRRLAYGFDRLGVSVDMVERRLGHRLSVLTAEELAELRVIYRTLKEGEGKREEYFEFEDESQSEEGAGTLAEKLATRRGKVKQGVLLSPAAGDNGDEKTKEENGQN